MSKTFDNIDRNRYYGLRKGDIVNLKGANSDIVQYNAEVVDYGGDNNRVRVQYYKKPHELVETDWVAEWCDIVLKIEDQIKCKPIVIEAFADNGEHSHWRLINPETGKLLWSEFPEEDKILYK